MVVARAAAATAAGRTTEPLLMTEERGRIQSERESPAGPGRGSSAAPVDPSSSFSRRSTRRGATRRRNAAGLDSLGVGVGLRRPHVDHVLEHGALVDWFEFTPENF